MTLDPVSDLISGPHHGLPAAASESYLTEGGQRAGAVPPAGNHNVALLSNLLMSSLTAELAQPVYQQVMSLLTAA